MKTSKELLAKARGRYHCQPFRLLTDWGELLILPPEFADEIRNDAILSFMKVDTKVRPASCGCSKFQVDLMYVLSVGQSCWCPGFRDDPSNRAR